MKKMIIIPLACMALLIGACIIVNPVSCHGDHSDLAFSNDEIFVDEAETDTDSNDTFQYVPPVIPAFVQNLIEDAEWSAETICVAKGKAYYFAYEELGRTLLIYDDEKILVADPTLQVDSFESGCRDKFYVSVSDKSKLIDFSSAESLRSMSSLSQLLPSFTKFSKDSTAGFGHNVYYSFTTDFPKKSVRHADNIIKWLVDKIADSQSMDENVPDGNALIIGYTKRSNGGWKYRGDIYNPHQIAKFASSLYFALKKGEYGTNEEDYPSYLFSILNLKAVAMNNRFVTYQQCTHDYNGGIHGYYTQRLISFDHEHRQEIDYNYLFTPQSKQQLFEMLKEAAKKNPKSKDREINLEEAICMKDGNGVPTGELHFPQPGLSDEGVVFSFQPYEIDCYAAGTFHFTIPYDKIKPLLTSRGKWCLGITN